MCGISFLHVSGFLSLFFLGKLHLISFILQHAGLCGVNPGDVVRMDSGETIAQWCRIYVQKFGVRCLSLGMHACQSMGV